MDYILRPVRGPKKHGKKFPGTGTLSGLFLIKNLNIFSEFTAPDPPSYQNRYYSQSRYTQLPRYISVRKDIRPIRQSMAYVKSNHFLYLLFEWKSEIHIFSDRESGKTIGKDSGDTGHLCSGPTISVGNGMPCVTTALIMNCVSGKEGQGNSMRHAPYISTGWICMTDITGFQTAISLK